MSKKNELSESVDKMVRELEKAKGQVKTMTDENSGLRERVEDLAESLLSARHQEAITKAENKALQQEMPWRGVEKLKDHMTVLYRTINRSIQACMVAVDALKSCKENHDVEIRNIRDTMKGN